MKQGVLFLLWVLAAPAWAQFSSGEEGPQPPAYSCTEAVSRHQRLADSLLQPLNKSQIPTRIFYDRVYPAARLKALA